jgi:hypothetical protein
VATLTIKVRHYVLILAFMTVVGPGIAYSQYESESEASIPLDKFYIKRHKGGVFRALLSKFTFGLSTGYGGTAFKHDLSGFTILQDNGRAPELLRSGLTQRYSNWVNDVTPSTSTTPGDLLVSSDTAELGFKSKTFSIPLKATLHFQFNRYRIGGGYSFDYTRIGEFRPLSHEGDINPFTIDKGGFFMKHYFGLIGAEVYRYYEYLLVVDANIGGYKLGKQFNKSLIQKSLYFNIGVTVEREMSEYFRLFVRPSYELKGYKLSIPETGAQIPHKLNAFYLNFGATYRIPELRRCYNKACSAQINHAHGNKEYRSRRHPIYKKQNPHYGENYPTLIKYKGKNKNKLNPY